MRLLMSLTKDPNALASCYVRGLAGEAVELHGLDLTAPPLPGGLAGKAFKRVIPWLALRRPNAALMKAATELKPDAVLIFKGMEIFPSTLRSLRDRGAFLVNYNADHPFEHFSRGSGNTNVIRSVPLYHLHITYSRKIAAQLRERYPGIPVAIVPFGHEVDDAAYDSLRCITESVRACFLGNPDDHRRRNIETLVEAGIPIDVYGFGWSNFLKPAANLNIHNAAIGADMLATLRRYRVQLNFFRPHNADSHNMRTFEVPACGGIMLGEDSSEHRDFFAPGREAFFFTDPQDMIAKARHILEMPVSEADAIRAAARRRSVEGRYSYRDRALTAIKSIEGTLAEHHKVST